MKSTPLNIKDPAAYSLAAELSRLTGKSMTRVVVDSLRHELEKYQTKVIDHTAVQDLLAELDRIPRHQDPRTDNQILGYDAEGKWS